MFKGVLERLRHDGVNTHRCSERRLGWLVTLIKSTETSLGFRHRSLDPSMTSGANDSSCFWRNCKLPPRGWSRYQGRVSGNVALSSDPCSLVQRANAL